MSEKKNRRKWTPKEKLRIVLETLQSEGKLSEICRREGLSPTLVYQWRSNCWPRPRRSTRPSGKHGKIAASRSSPPRPHG